MTVNSEQHARWISNDHQESTERISISIILFKSRSSSVVDMTQMSHVFGLRMYLKIVGTLGTRTLPFGRTSLILGCV